MTESTLQYNFYQSPAGGEIKIRAPYNPEAIKRFKNTNGNYRDGVWSFDEEDHAIVNSITMGVYGWNINDTKRINVRIQLVEDEALVGWGDSVYLFGVPLARAFGRDSGAKTLDGVVIVEGGVDSGGSIKNWNSHIIDGSIFEVRGLPILAYEKRETLREWVGDRIKSVEIVKEYDLYDISAERQKEVERIEGQIKALQDQLSNLKSTD